MYERGEDTEFFLVKNFPREIFFFFFLPTFFHRSFPHSTATPSTPLLYDRVDSFYVGRLILLQTKEGRSLLASSILEIRAPNRRGPCLRGFICRRATSWSNSVDRL